MSCCCGPKITVVVTGGGGYVGSHTVVGLLNDGYQVIALDNMVNCFSSGEGDKPEAIKRAEEIAGRKTIFYNVDIKDKAALETVFKKHKVDCVVHFAALKAVGESCKMPLAYYQNNIVGTSMILEVMKQHNVSTLVFSSSATVYGTPQFLPITEEHPTGLGCTNPYGKSKYFVEEILKDICAADKSWKIISLRYFNPVGAHESGRIGEDPTGTPNNLMPYIAQVAVGKRPVLQVYGNDYETPDGTGVRDYIHITDLATGHLRALDKLFHSTYPGGFKAYNLGTGKGNSVLEVINAFERASGAKIPYEFAPRRKGDIASSYADASLATKELRWKAVKTLDDMCRDTWNWQSKNPNGYANK